MPEAIKHVGKLSTNNRKCIVAYRVVPGEPDNCIVVYTESLDADMHDSLIKLVESNAGQTANELADAMARTLLPDGRNMLATFHTTGKLNKLPTKQVIMVPNQQSSVPLNELNELIAQQQGVSVEDLAVAPSNALKKAPVAEAQAEITEAPTAQSDGVLSDEDLASQYRSQADAMFKEAKRLREQAEELVPTKKVSKTKKSEESV
jgi:hypothetical protein